MNKKANDFFMFFVLIGLLVGVFLLIFNLALSINYDNECEQKCGSRAIDYEAKDRGSLHQQLTRTDKLTCICYYEDSIKVKKVRG